MALLRLSPIITSISGSVSSSCCSTHNRRCTWKTRSGPSAPPSSTQLAIRNATRRLPRIWRNLHSQFRDAVARYVSGSDLSAWNAFYKYNVTAERISATRTLTPYSSLLAAPASLAAAETAPYTIGVLVGACTEGAGIYSNLLIRRINTADPALADLQYSYMFPLNSVPASTHLVYTYGNPVGQYIVCHILTDTNFSPWRIAQNLWTYFIVDGV
jgi:hypothetical protein